MTGLEGGASAIFLADGRHRTDSTPAEITVPGSRQRFLAAHSRWLLLILFVPSLADFHYGDDGLLLRLGREANRDGWRTTWSTGFNGHLRPLPIATAAVALLVLPVAWLAAGLRLVSLALHVANCLLLAGIGRRWRCDAPAGVAEQAGLAMFICHASASEAVTHVAAIGILWSALGGLIVIAALTATAGGPCRTWAMLVVGLAVCLAGGEYCLAVLPVMMVAVIAGPTGPVRMGRRGSLAMVVVILSLFAGYVVLQLRLDHRGRVGEVYRLGPHVAAQLVENIGRLALPSTLASPACAVPAALAVAVALLAGRRPARTALLLAATVGALLPFAPSLAGNYHRFLYVATIPCQLAVLASVHRCNAAMAEPVRHRNWWLGAVLLCLAPIHAVGLVQRTMRSHRRSLEAAVVVDDIRRHAPADVIVGDDVDHVRDLCIVLGAVMFDRLPKPRPRELPPSVLRYEHRRGAGYQRVE